MRLPQKIHRDYENLKKDLTSIKNLICDGSTDNPTESVKSRDITLSGLQFQIKTLQETLGVDCIPKEKLANNLNVDTRIHSLTS